MHERVTEQTNEGDLMLHYRPADCVPQAIASCILDPEQGGYVISVETPVPLDLVLLHSQVHMDLLESSDEDDIGQASFESARSLAPFGV